MTTIQGVPDLGPGLRLHLNENTGGCSPKVVEAVRAFNAEALARYPDFGDAIADTAQFLGVDPDQDLDVVAARCAALHPAFAVEMEALLGITIAPTLLTGSSARNVLPGRASVGIDCRILPGDTQADLERELRAEIGRAHV